MARKVHRQMGAFDYVPKIDRELPSTDRSTFRFRPLTQAERMAALDTVQVMSVESDGSKSVRLRGFQQSYELVLATLLDVENFPAGEPVPYPISAPRAERVKYLDQLDDALIYELGQYVFDRSTLGDEEKNSSTP